MSLQEQDLLACVLELDPDAKFELSDNNYDKLLWSSANASPKPTLAECEAAWQVIVDAAPMKRLREERDRRLQKSDLYAIVDFPHADDAARQAWFTYRQALRDLPESQTPALDSEGQLVNVTWPTPPS